MRLRIGDYEMNDEEFRRQANALGLGRLAAQHDADLRKGLQNGKSLAERIPKDMHWSEEPAHTLSLITRTRVIA
ncbi:MAG: hypothetical protein CMB79_01795 [Filomicrobium sp.]|nr:hypothetical protein [Filomicrobium sp.]